MLCGGSGVGAKSQVGGVGSKWAEPTAGWAKPAAGGRSLQQVGGVCGRWAEPAAGGRSLQQVGGFYGRWAEPAAGWSTAGRPTPHDSRTRGRFLSARRSEFARAMTAHSGRGSTVDYPPRSTRQRRAVAIRSTVSECVGSLLTARQHTAMVWYGKRQFI